jgi:hypothetical protein
MGASKSTWLTREDLEALNIHRHECVMETDPTRFTELCSNILKMSIPFFSGAHEFDAWGDWDSFDDDDFSDIIHRLFKEGPYHKQPPQSLLDTVGGVVDEFDLIFEAPFVCQSGEDELEHDDFPDAINLLFGEEVADTGFTGTIRFRNLTDDATDHSWALHRVFDGIDMFPDPADYSRSLQLLFDDGTEDQLFWDPVFHPFNQLPIELRLEVWGLTIEPRNHTTIAIEWDSEFDHLASGPAPPVTFMIDSSSPFHRRYKEVPAFQVNQLSRYVARRIFGITRDVPVHSTDLIFSVEIDELCLRMGLPVRYPSTDWLRRYRRMMSRAQSRSVKRQIYQDRGVGSCHQWAVAPELFTKARRIGTKWNSHEATSPVDRYFWPETTTHPAVDPVFSPFQDLRIFRIELVEGDLTWEFSTHVSPPCSVEENVKAALCHDPLHGPEAELAQGELYYQPARLFGFAMEQLCLEAKTYMVGHPKFVVEIDFSGTFEWASLWSNLGT